MEAGRKGKLGKGIDMRQGEREGERYSATNGGKGRDGEREGREGKRPDYGMLLTFQGLTEGEEGRRVCIKGGREGNT